MTKEKLKEDYEKFASRPDIFDVWTAHSTDAVFDWFYSKLQEQDRKSRREVIRDIMSFGLSEEFLIEDYAKQHNIDLYEN